MAQVLGINLLSKIRPTFEKKKFSQKTRLWAVIILSVYVILVAGIFIVGGILSFQRKQIREKIVLLEQQIRSEQKKESLELALKERIGEIRKIIKGRTNYPNLITKVLSFLQPDVFIREIDLSSKDKISLSGEASNVLAMIDFLEKLKKENDFSRVYLNSFSRTKTGGYSFSLEIGFKEF